MFAFYHEGVNLHENRYTFFTASLRNPAKLGIRLWRILPGEYTDNFRSQEAKNYWWLKRTVNEFH